MACRERGMTLVTVILVLALMMVLALVLTDKVIQASRAAAAADRRQQALDAASAGIDWGRTRLAEDYAGSAGWQTYLSAAPGAHKYPAAPAFSLTVNGLPVELYIRDNADGDHDWRNDNDLRIYLLARVAVPTTAETVIEALCGIPTGLTAGSYRQLQPNHLFTGPDMEPGPVMEFSSY
ncbi:MAG TPA: hypothetical protein VJ910_06645 [Desulfuromonadales bacterium]|nr:hypothetical protein [Desulfuromonadales bacterium]